MCRKNGFSDEELPRAIFVPEVLRIRRKKGDKPIHLTIRWSSRVKCGNVDVKWLIEYIRSKKRDCHVNTGVHGKLNANDEFEYAWKENGGDQLRQDVNSAVDPTTKVSFHMITRKKRGGGPFYHVGVDTIDAFCYSWHKRLTEAELDEACEDFLDKEKHRCGAAQPDEKDSAEEQFADLTLQPDAQDQSDVDEADLVGGDIEKFEYDGYGKTKKFLLEWLRDASNLERLDLQCNEIVTIEKLTHLKALEYLDLGGNKI